MPYLDCECQLKNPGEVLGINRTMIVNSGMAIRNINIKFPLTSFKRCIMVDALIINGKQYIASNSQYSLKLLLCLLFCDFALKHCFLKSV